MLRKVWRQNRTILLTLLGIAVLFFPVGLAHELGHITQCWSEELDYKLEFAMPAMKVTCYGIENNPLYYSMGGIFGMIAAASLYSVKRFRQSIPISIAITVTAFDHFLKAILETFAHQAYLGNGILNILAGILAVILMVLLLRVLDNPKDHER
jgi:hypothetical protein